MAHTTYRTLAEVAATLEPDLDAAIGLGIRARSLLADETLALAIRDVKADLIQRWDSAETVEERERLHAEFRAIDSVMHQLAAFYNKGQLAQDMRLKEEAGP